ncbi:snRNA-activating protein complex subunit 3 [Colletes gigas]|uniref:snRNA-activating protein complex subunit 3 n=1 Tax=Colletes gigas TaxID=935657 RepID=UPI001C9A5D43|nr:snRNA-activating protein complex subunit 3 [Colletes gigas]XP_043255391.1 snRNA-activating protein complex subunit 3 [Colletes gigas]
MDDVYRLYNNNASPRVHIKEYFDEYKTMITSTDCFIPMKRDKKDYLSLMGVNLGEEEMSMLANYCSIDNLTVEGEMPKIINTRRMRTQEAFDPQLPEDVDLQTIQNLRSRLKLGAKRISYKYQSELFITHDKKTQAESDGECATPGKDILVFVRIYHPFAQRARNAPKTECGSLLRLNNVTAILGSQTLAQLKDKIPCIADYTISKECSNNLDNAVGPMAKDVYKSGFFFIEDTFYNDSRQPTNVDYSTVIQEWAKRRPKLGPFRTAIMENSRIDSLFLRFGYPWVYKHQGGCEHLIVFSDSRLINSDDDLAVAAYPQIVRLRPTSSKFCMICGVYSVQWITMEHERIPHNPCYFCDACFKSFNYIGKKKIGNFKAYAYPRNTELARKIEDI